MMVILVSITILFIQRTLQHNANKVILDECNTVVYIYIILSNYV